MERNDIVPEGHVCNQLGLCCNLDYIDCAQREQYSEKHTHNMQRIDGRLVPGNRNDAEKQNNAYALVCYGWSLVITMSKNLLWHLNSSSKDRLACFL